MRYSYEINTENRLAVITLEGRVSIVDIVAGIRAYSADPAWRPSFDRLWDGRRISELVLSPENIAEVRALVEQLRRRIGNGRIAFVARREIDLMIAKLFRLLFPKAQIAVFNNIRIALDWLERPNHDYLRESWENN